LCAIEREGKGRVRDIDKECLFLRSKMKRELDNMYVFVLEIDRERERGRERRRSLRKKENFII
jgi:hypothetical protein